MANPYDYFERPPNAYDVPDAQCPKCKHWQDDPDGFGVLKCLHCDYCQHAAIDGGVCGFCGITVGKTGSQS